MEILNYLKSIGKLNGGRALDVGSGQGFLAKQLVLAGFEVDAVDKEKTEDLGNPKIHQINQAIQDFEIKPEEYDLIIARNIFPFMPSAKIIFQIIDKLYTGLKVGGVMSFTLFGPRDDWADKQEMTFIEFDQALAQIPGKKLKTGTEYFLGPKMNGELKNWHIHHFVIEKL